eukprot:scaffold191446_cov46-Prasinocladus_malaysianus.AAC.1
MAALKSGVNQLGPDGRQVVLFCPKEVDALATGDLGVEAVLLSDLTQNPQLLGGDFSARNAGDNRIGAASLDVSKVAVV